MLLLQRELPVDGTFPQNASTSFDDLLEKLNTSYDVPKPPHKQLIQRLKWSHTAWFARLSINKNQLHLLEGQKCFCFSTTFAI